MMKTKSQARDTFVIENPCVDQMALVFPEDRVQETLTVFRTLLGNQRENVEVSQYCSLKQELAQLLNLRGWNCVEQKNGSLVLTEYTGRELDLEHDPVLVSAVGIVEPGSFVLGHSAHEFAPMWWVYYTAQEKHINWGLPAKEQIGDFMVCSGCGSLNPRDWHHVQYTAIRYPVKSVNPLHIVTIAEGEVLYECVIKEYLECSCGAELVRKGRDIV